jgi:hypothetical protein
LHFDHFSRKGAHVIAFQNEVQKACYDKVLRWMRELFADALRVRDSSPSIGVVKGSAFAEVHVVPWGDREAVINTRAWVVTEVSITPDLMKYLLQENYTMRFGAFGIDDRGDIVLQHTIVGSTCDREELQASVQAVVTQADRYDDLIIQRWGGARALTQGR